MVSALRPKLCESFNRPAFPPFNSPLGETPHKAGNGARTITCRNRHCPKCQTNARDKWLAARQQELLPADYYHVVFSVPHALVPLIWQNKKVLFKLLFDASAKTLLEVAADPKHLGAEIGFLSILHTWGQTLQPHPHIHCVVPGGELRRSPQVGSRARSLLPASQGTQPRISWKVRGRVKTRFLSA